MTPLVPPRIIEKKRQGEVLSREELEAFFLGFLEGSVPDYQMAAFLMAVYFRGMADIEVEALLGVMLASGTVLDLSDVSGPKVDKHSTGGVGDKTSLVVAPLAAELGLKVPMMSGRGLGHTTGTVDKLEAIPGFRTRLDVAEFRAVLREVGLVMVGQTEEIAPLDRRLYALRDATATVPSIPLIATSILSKKLAEDLDGLILDVKVGEGAFLTGVEDARKLALTMTAMARSRGVRAAALLTAMDVPLGLAIGNGLETAEAFRCLAGLGPPDLESLSLALVGEMLFLGGMEPSPASGVDKAREALRSGRALERMARLVARQGGDPRVVEEPDRMPPAPVRLVVEAQAEGVVTKVHPRLLGEGVIELGGGRRRMEDTIDPRVGFVLAVRPGDRVEVGQPLGVVHAADEGAASRARRRLLDAVEVGKGGGGHGLPLVLERIPPG